MNKNRLAAIDIGTNSFHIIIVEVDRSTNKFKTLGRERELVRLGTGSTDMKYLSDDAMERGLETLKRFKGLADSADATVRAIATSAVREAINQDVFIARVKESTGIKIETASGYEEARYIYLGVLQALHVFNKKILLVDIGGGSTEFLVGHKREIYFDSSLKIGGVRLTQRFFSDKETDPKPVKECRKFIRGMLVHAKRELGKHGFEIAVGSSGTIVGIAGMINIAEGGDPEAKLNNFVFSAEQLYDLTDKIIGAGTLKQRLKIPGMDPQRADIITASALILEQIFREFELKEITVSEYALREGIVLDTIEKRFRLKQHDHLHDLRYVNVIHLAESYRFEKEHSLHTAGIALSIFDQTAGLHRLNSSEREYLEAAAILHEVGCFVSHSQHHRHSYYLIRNSELLGFTENEKEIIANIARYHRKSHPKPKHAEFSKLNAEDQMIVKKLASILRIADGLDRTHSSVVKNVVCRSSEGAMSFLLTGEKNSRLELEIWGAEMKKKLFEETFGVDVSFEVVS